MDSNYKNIDKSKLQSAVSSAAKKSGINTESLNAAISSGKLDNVLNTLSKSQADTLKQMLGDKSALENLLKSPQAAKILKDLMK